MLVFRFFLDTFVLAYFLLIFAFESDPGYFVKKVGFKEGNCGDFAMRLKMAALWVFARLSWGELDSPMYWRKNRQKFFPPPRVMVFHQPRLNPFSRN